MYEAKVEYLPGHVKTFVSADRSWLYREVERALDEQVPTFTGAITLEKKDND